jgi:hypothetical protein
LYRGDDKEDVPVCCCGGEVVIDVVPEGSVAGIDHDSTVYVHPMAAELVGFVELDPEDACFGMDVCVRSGQQSRPEA